MWFVTVGRSRCLKGFKETTDDFQYEDSKLVRFTFGEGESVIICKKFAEFMLQISALRKMPKVLFGLWAVEIYFRVLSVFLQLLSLHSVYVLWSFLLSIFLTFRPPASSFLPVV